MLIKKHVLILLRHLPKSHHNFCILICVIYIGERVYQGGHSISQKNPSTFKYILLTQKTDYQHISEHFKLKLLYLRGQRYACLKYLKGRAKKGY